MTDVLDLTGTEHSAPPQVRDLMRQCRDEAAQDSRLERAVSPWGLPALREQLGTVLGESPDRLAITAGVRGAAVCLRPWLATVVVETPSFGGVPDLLTLQGATVTRSSVTELTSQDDAPVWVTHPARNPDGRSLDAHECAALTARTHTVVINEIYRWHTTRSLSAPTGDHVVTVGSLAKVIGPSARLGWIRGAIAPEVTKHALRASGPDPVTQGAWALFVARGGLADLETVSRAGETARHEFVAQTAHQFRHAEGVDGSSAVVELPAGRTVDDARRLLLDAGLVVADAETFGYPCPAVRIVFDAVPLERVAEVAERFSDALSGLRPQPG